MLGDSGMPGVHRKKVSELDPDVVVGLFAGKPICRTCYRALGVWRIRGTLAVQSHDWVCRECINFQIRRGLRRD